ncbi:MAG: SBBP repeat-containing protein [Blastocatellia bacterium]|nr:SBBP repeat-containing protein [Blastocatellia bacterium]
MNPNPNIFRSLVVIISAISLTAPLASGSARVQPDSVGPVLQTAAAACQQRPLDIQRGLHLRFEANRGQADPRARFVARGDEYTLAILPSAVAITRGSTTVLMRLVAASATPAFEGIDPLPGTTSYITGARTASRVDSFSKVLQSDVYPGIDALFYSRGSGLEYDFIVAPGADPDAIRVTFDGSTGAEIVPGGDLVVHTVGGEFRHSAPFLYQESESGQSTVAGAFRLLPGGQVGFSIGAYDGSKPLVIDPALAFSTLLGGGDRDKATDVAVDAQGFIYVAGITNAPDFPVTPNAFDTTINADACPSPECVDVFVSKLSPDARTLLYSTFIGGSQQDGGDLESPSVQLAVRNTGQVCLFGFTGSPDFPLHRPIQSELRLSDCFLLELDASGSALVFSTLLGGSGFEEPRGIDLDENGNICLTGVTYSDDFPTVDPIQSGSAPSGSAEGFITKVDAQGTRLLFSSLLTGAQPQAIVVGRQGSAYLTGFASAEFLTTPGAYQTEATGEGAAFVLCVDTKVPSLVFATYLGGNSYDLGFGIDVDAEGTISICGYTYSTDFPTLNAFQAQQGDPTGSTCDVFVARLDSTGSSLIYSTYLGPYDNDIGRAISVDAAGVAYVTGFTQKQGFPLRGAFVENADRDFATAFVTAVDPTGSVLFSVRVGALEGTAVEADGEGGAIVVGYSQYEGRDFPVTPGVIQTVGRGLSDAVVFRIDPVADVGISRIEKTGATGQGFKVRITGELFLPGARVFIGSDEQPWPNVRLKGLTRLVLSGTELKARFPRGVEVTVRVVNPDGGEATTTFTR